ncbi:PDR/VanB family oxidoreductase [Antrihabitans sp. YC2-6]|uniref:PDR/VanB family oxidoreductase n=1 Tax=Antrihabitans sp. YC2-6 TaxID=2799498 RepID=UPI0018F59E39|nr:PDR/VanB family oxidoreductase [Antrihabitans sp. YC2-6]MBJ8343877.1 oxidoreductase [Antrihabitans sp. YC2-6]
MATGEPVSTAVSGAKIHEFSKDLRVQRRHCAADGVAAIDLVDPAGGPLPEWQPGAHIDLLLDDKLVRQYSLCGDSHNTEVWRVAVLLDPNSRGGSRHVHERLVEGATVRIRGPRNHFPLVDSPRYLFIAGGIGITPMMPMIASAARSGSDWRLVYLGRQMTTMAFAEELADAYGDHVTLWPDDEKGVFDLAAALEQPEDRTLIYSCGPEPLLSAVEENSRHWPDGSLHVERFAAKAPVAEAETTALDSFQVVCQRSGQTIEVSAGESILEALEDADIPILSSCLQGVCGTCEATVLEGTPDHQDSMLTDAERASGNVILTCVSRSRTERLVLDL